MIQKSLVLNKKGQILILRRNESDDRRPLQWDIPGGRLETGEELIAGVEREIREESNLGVTGTRVIFTKTERRSWDGGEGNAVFIFYVSYAQSIDVTVSKEHDRYRWVTLQEAIELFEYNLHREFFNYILSNKVAL